MKQTFQGFQKTLHRTYIRFKMFQHHVSKIQCRIPLWIETTKFIIKTASTSKELEEVLRLRYQVFLKEGLNQKRPIQLDLDPYDFVCDHLILIDKLNKKVVGTYRLISSLFSDRFYSQDEFHLDDFLEQPGIKLELGRACIDKSYRGGILIALLWRGVTEYMRITNTQYLFGCASVKTTNPLEIFQLTEYLRQEGHLSQDFSIAPTLKFQIPPRPLLSMGERLEAKRDVLPPLLMAYLKAGAKVYGEAAWDKDFRCYDLLTIMTRSQMSEQHERKFLGLAS